jgi:hypothetical protein
MRRRDNVQEVIKNEYREERKKQHHVLPGPAYIVSSWYSTVEMFTAESQDLRARFC